MSGRIALPMAAVALCLHLGLSYSHNFLVGADDDRLWLYTTGAEIGRADRAAALNAAVRDSMTRDGATDSQIYRFALRQGYRGNYAATAYVYRTAAAATQSSLGPEWGRDYPSYAARAIYAGFVSMYAVACALLLLIVFSVTDRRWLMATVLAIAATALLETVFDLAGDTWSGLPTLLPDAQTRETFWQNFWPNFPALFINPQVQLSPFGDTPRNHFILLMLPLFLLRWRGWLTASYVWLAALGFLHQSHTGLVLAYLLAVDAVLRPSIFRSRAALIAGFILIVYVGRESLGQVIGVARPAVLIAAALAVSAVSAAAYFGLRERTNTAAARLRMLRETLLSRGVVFADLAMLGLILAVSFPLVAVLNAIGSEAQSLYFWTQVHGRSLGILRPALMLGLAFLVLTRLEARVGHPRAQALAIAFALVALVPSAYEALSHNRTPIARIESQTRALDTSIGAPIDWDHIGTRVETEIYYAIARTLETGR